MCRVAPGYAGWMYFMSARARKKLLSTVEPRETAGQAEQQSRCLCQRFGDEDPRHYGLPRKMAFEKNQVGRTSKTGL